MNVSGLCSITFDQGSLSLLPSFYLVANGTWSLVNAQGLGPSARDKVSSTVIGDKVYIFGGFGPQGTEDESVGFQTQFIVLHSVAYPAADV